MATITVNTDTNSLVSIEPTQSRRELRREVKVLTLAEAFGMSARSTRFFLDAKEVR